jgi:putative SOS response-associated peptidase YedK
MQWFYEPNYASGKSERWRIERADGAPLWVGGLWDQWRDPHGIYRDSFTMLTLNADHHPVMKQFHALDDEKRMLVMLALGDVQAWLHATSVGARDLFGAYPAESLRARSDPKPPRPKSTRVPRASETPAAVTRDLFGE